MKACLAATLLERLEAFVPKFASGEVRWQNYRLRGSAPMPVIFKGPLNRPLSADAVYEAVIHNRKGEKAKVEGDRATVDHLEIRLYPQPDDAQVQAELCYVLCYVEFGKDEEVFFRGGKPLRVVRFVGPDRKGLLFFTPPESNTEVVVREAEAEVVFSGPTVVQITGGSEEPMPNGAVKIVLEGDGSEESMVVYDHRSNRFSPFAAVEHIRKTVGRRSYEFFNLRDFSGDKSEIGHILTEEGLQEV